MDRARIVALFAVVIASSVARGEPNDRILCGTEARELLRTHHVNRSRSATGGAACERLCHQGVTEVCATAAILLGAVAEDLENDTGNPRNMARAASLYRSSCELGFADACFNAGRFYLHGWQVKRDPARAAVLWRRGCDAKGWISCARLAERYQLGDGVKRDVARAQRLAQTSCSHGEARGCTALAGILQEQGHTHDAVPLYERACAKDDPDACAALGELYEQGDSVAKDLGRALELAKKSCRPRYYGNGCVSLGRYLLLGVGVRKDVAAAARAFEQGCDSDAMAGCLHLAQLLLAGGAVRRDEARGIALLRRACDGGLQLACDQLPTVVDRTAYSRAVAGLHDNLEACYRADGVAGSDRLDLTIGVDGKVSRAALAGTLASNSERGCVIAAAREARFPTARTEWHVALPLMLP